MEEKMSKNKICDHGEILNSKITDSLNSGCEDCDDEFQEKVCNEGDVIAYQGWDSGIMADTTYVYEYEKWYYVQDNVDPIMSFKDKTEAIKRSGVMMQTDATKIIHVDGKTIYKDEKYPDIFGRDDNDIFDDDFINNIT